MLKRAVNSVVLTQHSVLLDTKISSPSHDRIQGGYSERHERKDEHKSLCLKLNSQRYDILWKDSDNARIAPKIDSDLARP